MKLFFLIVLIPVGLTLAAQKNSGSSLSSFNVYYGYRSYFQNFYNQINSVNNTEFNRPLQLIGIGESGQYAVNREGNFHGHFIYSQVIPQKIYIQDSLKGKITGFVFSAAYGKAFTPKESNFSLFVYVGFNTGRLRIFGNELIKQKNPFFSPKLGFQPKINLGKLCVLLQIECEYDISKSSWRRTAFSNNDKIDINSLRQTGVTGQIGIGYILD